MALKRMVVELGMGTDLRGSDYTKAAIRALKDALWHNSLTIAPALGKKPEDMHVKVLVGVPKPDLVDKAAAALPGYEMTTAPEGYVKVESNHHLSSKLRIGQWRADGQADVVYESDLIAPDPFPKGYQ